MLIFLISIDFFFCFPIERLYITKRSLNNSPYLRCFHILNTHLFVLPWNHWTCRDILRAIWLNIFLIPSLKVSSMHSLQFKLEAIVWCGTGRSNVNIKFSFFLFLIQLIWLLSRFQIHELIDYPIDRQPFGIIYIERGRSICLNVSSRDYFEIKLTHLL